MGSRPSSKTHSHAMWIRRNIMSSSPTLPSNSEPQTLAMAVRCFAPSVRVIPGSGTVSAFLYWARNIHILRASAATSFHSTHVKWINTCDAKGNTIKRQDQSEDFLTIPEVVRQDCILNVMWIFWTCNSVIRLLTDLITLPKERLFTLKKVQKQKLIFHVTAWVTS